MRLSSREALAASEVRLILVSWWWNLAGGGLKAKLAKTAGYVAFDGVRYFWCEQTEELLSGREHLAGVQQEIKTCCVGQVKTGKVRFVWPGAPRRRPTRCQDLLCWTGKDRESKIVWPGAPRRRPTRYPDLLCWTGKDRESKINWPGAPRWRPTGDRDSPCWTGKDRRK